MHQWNAQPERELRPSSKALPEHARSHNRSLVLQQLYRAEGLSRADIARVTGLTRVTVSDLVSDMIAEGLITELGAREASRPGKPAIQLALNEHAFDIIGVDLSDTTAFRAGILGMGGTVREIHTRELNGRTGTEAVDTLIELLEHTLAATQHPILGIGLGTPGIVEAHRTVRHAPNLRWTDLDLYGLLAERFGEHIVVANDANAAVHAEHSFGAKAGDLLLLQIGAGVGSGIVVNGRPVFGAASAAGEIGHVVVGTDGGPACACGMFGCLEAWVSIPGLERLCSAASTPQLRDEVLRNAGERLGIALSPVVGMLNVSEVVISGPAHLLGGVFVRAVGATIRKRTLPLVHEGLTVRMTELGDTIIMRGAAALVLSAQLGLS